MAAARSRLVEFWNHPAGPKTIVRVTFHRSVQIPGLTSPVVASWQFFWAPTFKWGISIANISDMKKPTEQISLPQQLAVACTGIIWMRYSLVITPVNYNLFSVRGTTHGQTAVARQGARSGRCMYAALSKRHLPSHCLSVPLRTR